MCAGGIVARAGGGAGEVDLRQQSRGLRLALAGGAPHVFACVDDADVLRQSQRKRLFHRELQRRPARFRLNGGGGGRPRGDHEQRECRGQRDK
ncbi:hypothetical protein SDC9_156740 [bioreactor metagenome]|uniref:Uncharacterized protein n=1 Tax=bioreactor metagenome TaxID=1076179 RepID=A0A645F6F0_9ZZZZ